MFLTAGMSLLAFCKDCIGFNISQISQITDGLGKLNPWVNNNTESKAMRFRVFFGG